MGNIKFIFLTKRTQSEKAKYSMIPIIRYSGKSKTIEMLNIPESILI